MGFRCGFLLLVLGVAGMSAVRASERDILMAAKVVGKIHHDGRLDEAEWQHAQKIRDFRQREPNEGQPATERTGVAVLYDTHNIYFGIWCYDSNMAQVAAKQMKRDFSWGGEDNIEIMISPFNDNRNGYSFVTNPNGAMADSWLGGDSGNSYNTDWNYNNLDLPGGVLKVHEIGGRIDYALNPHLNSSLFAQWNNESEEILLNYRINWIPKIGSYFYFVVNQNISTHDNQIKLTRTTILGKLIWRFAI